MQINLRMQVLRFILFIIYHKRQIPTQIQITQNNRRSVLIFNLKYEQDCRSTNASNICFEIKFPTDKRICRLLDQLTNIVSMRGKLSQTCLFQTFANFIASYLISSHTSCTLVPVITTKLVCIFYDSLIIQSRFTYQETSRATSSSRFAYQRNMKTASAVKRQNDQQDRNKCFTICFYFDLR